MVSAQALEGVLVYKYRLLNLDSDQVDPGLLKTKVKPELVSGTCNTQDLRDKFFENGVTLRYTYFGRDEGLIGSVDVTPADCGL
jgi:hypothetical protein